jgi:hypothetical protein
MYFFSYTEKIVFVNDKLNGVYKALHFSPYREISVYYYLCMHSLEHAVNCLNLEEENICTKQ